MIYDFLAKLTSGIFVTLINIQKQIKQYKNLLVTSEWRHFRPFSMGRRLTGTSQHPDRSKSPRRFSGQI